MNYLTRRRLTLDLEERKKKKKKGGGALYAAEGIIGRKLSVRARKMWVVFLSQ